ncbi:hypothetical protein F5Y05DRAFT_29833 [Hypoxylon sp. FL0543]|nr:hypothetical protein F5Y05DRAFT_29833 [Hypoxylon sp. FL0543]
MTRKQGQKRKRAASSHAPDKRRRQEIPHQRRPAEAGAAGQQARRAAEGAGGLGEQLVDVSPASPGRVLLLRFDYVSQSELSEARRIGAAFRSKGFELVEYGIPMRNSSQSLKNRLEEFLKSGDANTVLVIYYQGHGKIDRNGELMLSGCDKRRNPGTGLHRWVRVAWSDIRKLVLVAKRNVGIFLECCYAGAAARGRVAPEGDGVTAAVKGVEYDRLPKRRGYQKEVISATSWGEMSCGKMGKALCFVLDKWNPEEDGSLSMETLYERMVARLALESDRARAPQPVRWRLHGSESGKVRLPHIRWK